ncbi:hypothetical protein SAMN06265373_102736 [Shimia sagamensis]|uniref:Uncharacterized protein n=1 Tax=Shimia sagamensis TaxID=1566352 RepID=A0ABY1NSG9_9RHOB|nr:hypothetical protein SAMN06265373_102736 [Shimia sagamensis]
MTRCVLLRELFVLSNARLRNSLFGFEGQEAKRPPRHAGGVPIYDLAHLWCDEAVRALLSIAEH